MANEAVPQTRPLTQARWHSHNNEARTPRNDTVLSTGSQRQPCPETPIPSHVVPGARIVTSQLTASPPVLSASQLRMSGSSGSLQCLLRQTAMCSGCGGNSSNWRQPQRCARCCLSKREKEKRGDGAPHAFSAISTHQTDSPSQELWVDMVAPNVRLLKSPLMRQIVSAFTHLQREPTSKGRSGWPAGRPYWAPACWRPPLFLVHPQPAHRHTCSSCAAQSRRAHHTAVAAD